MQDLQSRGIDASLEAEMAAVAEGEGCELAHVEFKGGTLRLILDRPEGEEGGVSLAHCEAVSKQVSALLDVSDFGAGRYVLEVSSPGLDRELYGPRDYERFVGRNARVTFFEKVIDSEHEAAKRTVVGRMEAFEPEAGGTVTLIETVGKNEHRHRIPLPSIKRARLEIEL